MFYIGILNATCLTFGLKLEDFNGRDHFLAFLASIVHVLGLISGMIELQMFFFFFKKKANYVLNPIFMGSFDGKPNSFKSSTKP